MSDCTNDLLISMGLCLLMNLGHAYLIFLSKVQSWPSLLAKVRVDNKRVFEITHYSIPSPA